MTAEIGSMNATNKPCMAVIELCIIFYFELYSDPNLKTVLIQLNLTHNQAYDRSIYSRVFK